MPKSMSPHRALQQRALSVFLLGALLAAGATPAAFAQNILVLRTGETRTAVGVDAMANVESEFASVASHITYVRNLQTPNAISAATFDPGYDLVVVASTYDPIDASNWDVIQTAASGRRAPAFTMFIDGCNTCSRRANMEQMALLLQASKAGIGRVGRNLEQNLAFELNSSSPYADSFSALDRIYGGYVTFFDGVPAENALYLNQGASAPAAGTFADDVYGVIVPQTQSFSGAGACLFATVDSTLFTSIYGLNDYQRNQGKLAPAFLNAIKPGGACVPPHLGLAKSQPSPALRAGGTAAYTLTVTNRGPGPARTATVLEQLPAGLTFESASGSGWSCDAGQSPLRCTYAAPIAANGGTAAPLDITVRVDASATGTTVTNYASVDPNARAGVAAAAAPPAPGPACTPAESCAAVTSTIAAAPANGAAATPVPTLSEWALTLLSLLGAGLGLARLRARSRAV